MKIAIDISPLSNNNKVRGIGFYLLNLKKTLIENFKNENFIFFENTITEKVDLVFYPYFDPFKITLPIIKKIPTVITIHDLTPIVFKKYFPAGIKGSIIWEIQKNLLKSVDAIITDSNNSKRDIIKLTGVDERKINTVYLAAGYEFKQIKNDKLKMISIKKKYNLPDKFGLYVGDVTWNKNLPRVIDAFKKTDIPLVMIGKALVDGDFDRGNIWNKDRIYVLENTNNKTQFIKLGFVSTQDLVRIYNLATFSITASLYEGFGLPVVEAMSCGTPVIASRLGSLPEIGEEAVHYVDAYSIESIEKGIKEVFTNKALQKSLSEKGLKQAEKFSWNKTAGETLKVLKNTIRF